MQRKLIIVGSLLVAVIAGLSACYYDSEEDLYGTDPVECSNEEVKYSVQVLSILQKNCYACHSNGSNIGNLLLDNYTGVRNAAINGTLLGSVNHAPGFSAMPQNAPKLATCDIQALQSWLDSGTPNN